MLGLPSPSTVTAALLAAFGVSVIMSANSLLRLKQRAFEIKRREERTKIVFSALQLGASIFGSYMLAERNRSLDASIRHLREVEEKQAAEAAEAIKAAGAVRPLRGGARKRPKQPRVFAPMQQKRLNPGLRRRVAV